MLKSIQYYDRTVGRDRIKRRYAWAFWFFFIGIGVGVAVAHLI